MSRQTQELHPLLALLSDLSFDVFLKESQFSFYLKLKEALILDNKDTIGINDDGQPFFEPINDTFLLWSKEDMVLHALISDYACSVVQPLIEELNNADGVDDYNVLNIYLDGKLDECSLFIDGDIDSYVSQLEDPSQVLDILAEWKNTLPFIQKIDELQGAVENKF